MKLLRASDNEGQFLGLNGEYVPIDKVSKDDLLRLVNLTLKEENVEFDEYDEKTIKNQAHQVIYKNVVQKLCTLREQRHAFVDESARLFLEEYERYRDASRG